LRPDSRDRTILIIGDSLTDYSMGFHLPSLVSPDFTIYYNGKKGYDFPMWSAVIEEAFSIPSPPGHVVVALGTNDALHNGTRDFLTNLQSFHTKLRARTSARVYYCMMPLTIQPELISFISQNNDVLRRTPLFANTEKIDLESAFSTAPSYPYLYNLDLIHPTEAGYMIIGGRVVDAVTH
jgi:lysophospholipase L1-like esterase